MLLRRFAETLFYNQSVNCKHTNFSQRCSLQLEISSKSSLKSAVEQVQIL